MPWDKLTALLESAAGDYSLCVWRAGAPVYGYREHVTRSAASLIKVPLAMAIVDADIDLDAVVRLQESDRVTGDGAFDRAPAGTTATLRDLVGYALTESDNTASNLLLDRIGVERVNVWLAERGLATRLRRKFMDLESLRAGRDNTTTAADMCAIFDRLREARYVSLIDLLSHSVADGKLEAGLPPGVRLAHKVGDLPGVEHDAGIVFAPGSPYVIAALAVHVPDSAAGRGTIAEVSRLVWERVTRRHGDTETRRSSPQATGNAQEATGMV
jgi:beta-lactamase class A